MANDGRAQVYEIIQLDDIVTLSSFEPFEENWFMQGDSGNYNLDYKMHYPSGTPKSSGTSKYRQSIIIDVNIFPPRFQWYSRRNY